MSTAIRSKRAAQLIAAGVLTIVTIVPPLAPAATSGEVPSPEGAGQSTGPFTEMRGMTISTPRGSAAWASDEIVGTIAELADLGVNWIAIHPYGRVSTDGTVSWTRPRRERGGNRAAADPGGGSSAAPPSSPSGIPEVAPDWLRRPIEEAHRKGLKILVKPHLENWRDYEWRGDIRYHSPEDWQRFFATYREWIVALARFSADADAFAVGTELGGTTHHDDRWREIIAAVREVHPGHLTYAANWDAYERVGFWDALDSVGIQAYFPVLDAGAGHPQTPPQSAFDDGWRDIMSRVRVFSAAVGRPVIFTEAGYNNSPRAPFQPWDWQQRGRAEELQVRCMIAALRAIEAESTVLGAFLWKWYPGDRLPRDFAMAAPHVRQVIREHWRGSDSR